MKIIITIISLIIPLSISAKVKVISSTSDFAYIAGQIGQDKVEASAIASPKADIHFVEVRPSYMAKVARADIILKVGMGLDKWMDQLIDGSRNNKAVIIDCSEYIEPLEVPTFKADARHGEIHPEGNPHYWIGPQNLESIVRSVFEGLVKVIPESAEFFENNKAEFLSGVKTKLSLLDDSIALLYGKEIIYYHNSWVYFNEFTGIKPVNFVEPYPGVPPSPSHIKNLIEQINEKGIKVIAMEPYFDTRVPKKIANETGAKVITIYPSIGGKVKNQSYIDWLEGNIQTLTEALND